MIIKKPKGELSANLTSKQEIKSNVNYFLNKAFHKNELDTCKLPFVSKFHDHKQYSKFIADYFMDDLSKGQKIAGICDIVSFSPEDFDVNNLTLQDKQKAFKIVNEYAKAIYGTRSFIADYHVDNGQLHYHLVVKNKDKFGSCYTTKSYNDFEKKEQVAHKLEMKYKLKVVENRKCNLQNKTDFEPNLFSSLKKFEKHNPALYKSKIEQMEKMVEDIKSCSKQHMSPQSFFQELEFLGYGVNISSDNKANLAYTFTDGINNINASKLNLSVKSLKKIFSDFTDVEIKDAIRQASKFKPKPIEFELGFVGAEKTLNYKPKTKAQSLEYRLKKYATKEDNDAIHFYKVSKSGYEYPKLTYYKNAGSVSVHEVSSATVKDAILTLLDGRQSTCISTSSTNMLFNMEIIKQSAELGLFENDGFEIKFRSLTEFKQDEIDEINNHLRSKNLPEIHFETVNGSIVVMSKPLEAPTEAIEPSKPIEPIANQSAAPMPSENGIEQPTATGFNEPEQQVTQEAFADFVNELIEDYPDLTPTQIMYFVIDILDDADIDGELNEIHEKVIAKIHYIDSDVKEQIRNEIDTKLDSAEREEFDDIAEQLERKYLIGTSDKDIAGHKQKDNEHKAYVYGKTKEEKEQYYLRAELYDVYERIKWRNPDLANELNIEFKNQMKHGNRYKSTYEI